MTASELLKQHILENVLNQDLLEDDEKEWVKSFDDLLELCIVDDEYNLITEFIDDYIIESNKRHCEYGRYYVEQVIKIDDKYIELSYLQDDYFDKYKEYFNRILKGINEAKFVEPYQELVTFYRNV